MLRISHIIVSMLQKYSIKQILVPCSNLSSFSILIFIWGQWWRSVPLSQSCVQTSVSTICGVRELQCRSKALLLGLKADLDATVKINIASASLLCLQELEIDLNLVSTNSKYPNLLESLLRLHPSIYLIQIFLDLVNWKKLVIPAKIITTSFTKPDLLWVSFKYITATIALQKIISN